MGRTQTARSWQLVREEYPSGLRERAVRMVAAISDQHTAEWAAISSCRAARCRHGETASKWVRQA
jgi:hypothetical protein